ncbi:enterokinase [Mytilus galloprovincialis]|uniref:Enterokinase n=2 Tax=Mytilus galloprovincialis TaxID=29158 RepID=A0A8B6G4N9_MYTGA|nr:enterokinase [Mytilus galloprovincialis]
MMYVGKCREVTSTKFCGTNAPPTFKGEGSMCIEFRSDQMVTRPGFQVLIKKFIDTSQQQTTDYSYLDQSTIEQFLSENNPNSKLLLTDGGFHTSFKLIDHSSAEISPSFGIDNAEGSTIVDQIYTQTLTVDKMMLISSHESQKLLYDSILIDETNEIKVTHTLNYQHSQILPTESSSILVTESRGILQTGISSIIPTQSSSMFATLSLNALSQQSINILSAPLSNTQSTHSSIKIETRLQSSSNLSLQLPSILSSLQSSTIMPSQSASILSSQSRILSSQSPSIMSSKSSSIMSSQLSSIMSSQSTSILSSQSSSFLSTYDIIASGFSGYSVIFTPTKGDVLLPSMLLSSTLLTDIYYGFSYISRPSVTTPDIDITTFVNTFNDDKQIKEVPYQKTVSLTQANTLSSDMSFNSDYFISKMYDPTFVRFTSSYNLVSDIQDISDIFKETPHMSSFTKPPVTNTLQAISDASDYGVISDIDASSSILFVPKSSIANDPSSTEVPSTYHLPVACYMTEQICVNDTGSLVVGLKPSTGQLGCSWLLLGNVNETIEVNITCLNVYTGIDCESEGVFVYDGFSANDDELINLCNYSSYFNLLSSGAALFVEVITRIHINFTLEYNPRPKGLDCSARLSKCGDRNCLPSEWWCDSEADCYHGEDEQSCGPCGKDEFRCGNGQCINDILQCNGRCDCDDTSDENDCAMLDDMVLRIRHGRSWLPVCADELEDTVGDIICKYLSFDNISGSRSVPSNQIVYMSRKQGQQGGSHLYSYLHPSTVCQSKTEIILNCSKKACGKRSPSLMVPYIIGGTQAYKGQWPWVVAVRKGNNFICGGTLISDRWVITAGHCVESVLSVPHMVSIATGTPLKDGRDGHVIRVSEIIMNPDYNFIYKADIAVLLLQMPVPFDDYTKPICLPNTLQHIPRDSICYTAGWGLTDPKDATLQKRPNDLMYAKAFMWTNSKCSLAYSSDINDGMVCAGILAEKGGDTCQGDSGGPLMCTNNDGTWQLVGVTSWGGGICGKSTLPGVYTRVAKLDTWIKTVTSIRDQNHNTKCDFEEPGICSLEDISMGSFMWTKRKAGWTLGGQPLTDSTTRTSKGHYVYADTYMVQANQSNNAVLKHRIKDNGRERCLTFSYKFFNNNCLKLSVVDVRNDGVQHELWELSYISGDWMDAAIAIASPVTEIHVVASRIITHFDGGIAIDDIEVLNRTCNEWCLWFNGDNFPSGTKAKLTSSILHSSGPRCFRFVYKLCHQNANYLSVLVGYVFNGIKFYGSSLWTRSVGNIDCSVWSKGHVDIPSIALDHFIAIQVERGYQSDSVYIDDIMLQSGNCFK